jgi:hypothetical protein
MQVKKGTVALAAKIARIAWVVGPGQSNRCAIHFVAD